MRPDPHIKPGLVSGGKVTRLLADEVADPLFIEELDATDVTPAALRQIEQTMHHFSWGKGGRAYVVNEAHGLRRDTIRQLLVLLERLSVAPFSTRPTGCLGTGCASGH